MQGEFKEEEVNFRCSVATFLQLLVAPRDDIGDVVMAAKQNKDSMICCLAKAARIIRKEILQVKNTINRTFAAECQQHAVPASLKTFLHLIFKGSNSTINPDDNKACLTIAQLMVFNSVSRVREKPELAGSTHHIRARECPPPIYTAIKIHGVTRNHALIHAFYHLGLSISYDRLLSISTEIANNVVGRYESEGVVCPLKLREAVFTTAAVDNIDHNPSATTSKDSFHGTAISLAQHPTTENDGMGKGYNL